MSDKTRKKIAVVLGTRPEAIKLAPVIQQLRALPEAFETQIISTGQHKEMLEQIFTLFEITPDISLDLMKHAQSLEYLAAEALKQLPQIFVDQNIDLVIAQGDTSTAFISSLAAFYKKIPVAHVEAGLRTYNKHHPFPEEINRKLIGQIADIHFAPTSSSKNALLKEAIPAKDVYLTGNTVIDALLYTVNQPYEFENQTLQALTEKSNRIVLLTAHRRENHGAPLENICSAVAQLVEEFSDIEVVYPVHLNPKVQDTVRSLLSSNPRIHLIEPLDYQQFVHLIKHSYLVLTDSGGVQEEAPSLGKPVLVLRETTERPEAVDAGTALMVGTDRERIIQESRKLLHDQKHYETMANAVNPYGDGKAAKRIAKILLNFFGFSNTLPEEFSA